jgi:multiple sugar transport system permease protein
MKSGVTWGKWLDMPVGASRAGWRRFWSDSALAYLFLLPSILILGTFSFYPVIKAFVMSLYEWKALSPVHTFIGLENYRELFQGFFDLGHDHDFRRALWNTLVYIVGTVPLEIALSLGVALLLNKKLRFRPLYRLAFFTPYVTTVVAVAIVWRWLYDENYGLIKQILGWFHIGAPKFLLDPHWSMFTIIVVAIWKSLGYTTVIYLAGLQNVDKELMNAAKVDGASGWQVFRHVTWPLLSPTTFFVAITSMIGAFKVFTEIFVLYGGQPGKGRSALTIVYFIVEQARDRYDLGFASAAGYVLFFIVILVTLLQLWYAKRHVHYD